MKKVLIAILFLIIITGCALKPVNNTNVLESPGELFNGNYIHPEVSALLIKYESFIGEVIQRDNDIGFLIGDTWIYYRNGRMLTKGRVQHQNQYHSIFYDYPLGRITKIPEYQEQTVRSHDFLDHLFGTTEIKLREQCDWVPFLNHNAYMNHFCEDALKNVEVEILKAAESDQEVQAFIDNLKTIYSFQQRNVRGTENASYHSYGLALDLVPISYERKYANWMWSTAFIKEWHLIPIEQRWSPPQAVIEAFEKNGFVWGGKWVHFDAIHFEYAPEIILLAQRKVK